MIKNNQSNYPSNFWYNIAKLEAYASAFDTNKISSFTFVTAFVVHNDKAICDVQIVMLIILLILSKI